MYSEKVIEKSQSKLEKALKLKLKRYSVEESLTVTDHLQSLMKKGKLKRGLTKEEDKFVTNERLLSQIDFSYALRYFTVPLDGSVGIGVGTPKLWESQLLTLNLMAKIEEENMELFAEGSPCPGICLAVHKSRQLGCTCLSRLIVGHRINFWPQTRSLGASIDENKIHDQLYKRDKLIYDNLPWFLKSPPKFDVKNVHFELETGAYIMYQKDTQESGLGQGSQFDVSHLTEVASWDHTRMIELDFIPTIPQSPYAFCIFESTAHGRGDWWHEFTEKVRLGKMYRWHYVYWPWYVTSTKYKAKPPTDWTPEKFALAHANMVKETSHRYVGKPVELSKEQLYWYQMSYLNAREKGELNLFLLNFSATPEESFQHSGIGAFDTEMINDMRTAAESAEHRSFEFVPY